MYIGMTNLVASDVLLFLGQKTSQVTYLQAKVTCEI